MIISNIIPTSYSGMYKISPDGGTAFYSRQEYLSSVHLIDLVPDMEISDAQADELLESGFACVVELKAVTYLARCEQSRFGLTQKLYAKKYEKKHIQMALDFLESKNYLSDQRFASAWLNTRKLNHYEGRTRLLAELTSRGISKDVCQTALDDFFKENNEYEICQKALEKYQKKGKTEEKLISAMIQSGFTYKMVKEIIK